MNLINRLNARDYFDSLGREEEHESRKMEAQQNPRVTRLIRGLERAFMIYEASMKVEKYESSLIKSLEGKKNILSKDIETLCLLLGKYEGKEHSNAILRDYLNVMVTRCSGSKVILRLNHLREPLHSICENMDENKQVTIYGDVGHLLGGNMLDGEVIVLGNAGDFVGQYMHGGIIRVMGNIGYRAGHIMVAGEIYHKDKLIVKDGEKI